MKLSIVSPYRKCKTIVPDHQWRARFQMVNCTFSNQKRCNSRYNVYVNGEVAQTNWISVGENVRRARLQQQLTREELAALSGINRSSLFRVETGKPIRVQTLKRIADAMDIELDWIYHYRRDDEKSYMVHRRTDDRWFAILDSRLKFSADRFQGYQDADERYRLGTVGFVTAFVCVTTNHIRFELYGKYEGPFNSQIAEKGTFNVLAGSVRAVVDGDELFLESGDVVILQSETLESIECAAKPGAEGYPALLIWSGSEPIQRKKKRT